MKNIENIPEDVIEEIEKLTQDLIFSMVPLIESVSPNIALNGLNWMVPVMLKHLVTNNPEELRKAAKMNCLMILKNMEMLIEEMEKDKS